LSVPIASLRSLIHIIRPRKPASHGPRRPRGPYGPWHAPCTALRSRGSSGPLGAERVAEEHPDVLILSRIMPIAARAALPS